MYICIYLFIYFPLTLIKKKIPRAQSYVLTVIYNWYEQHVNGRQHTSSELLKYLSLTGT
jgi:hypothetical protein